jgi:hypothetical protein
LSFRVSDYDGAIKILKVGAGCGNCHISEPSKRFSHQILFSYFSSSRLNSFFWLILG